MGKKIYQKFTHALKGERKKKRNPPFFSLGAKGVAVEAERKEEGRNKGHFLMLSRRTAVLYCVAWGLFSPANLSMLQWPARLWPPSALYRATTKAWECCLFSQRAPSLLYSRLPSPAPLPLLHLHTHTDRQASLLWAPGRHVSVTECDRRQSLINHVYTAGAQNII